MGRDAARGVGWVAIEKWSTRLVSLVVLVVLGRLLTPTEFGLVALATVFMTFMNIFVDQGFGRALVQRDDLTDTHSSTAFWISLLGSGALGGLLILTAPFIAAAFGEPQLAPVIQVMSVGLVLYALASVPQALLERQFAFRSLARRRITGTLAGGLVAVVAAFLGFGVWSLVIQVLVTAGVGVLMLWAASDWRPRFVFSRQAVRDLWPTGFSIVGIELVGFLNSQSDRLLVGLILDATALGYYTFAMRIISILIELCASIFSGISLTTFSRLQSRLSELRAWMFRLSSASCLIAIPAFAIVAAVGQEAVPLIFGAQWQESGTLVQILCLLGAVNAIAVFDRNALVAVGRNSLAFSLTLGQALFGIVLVAAALPLGVTAIAWAVSLRQLAWWPVRLIALKRAIGVAPLPYASVWLRPFWIGLVSSAVGFITITYWWPLLGSPVLYVIVGTAVTGVAVALLYAAFERRSVRDMATLLVSRRSKG